MSPSASVPPSSGAREPFASARTRSERSRDTSLFLKSFTRLCAVRSVRSCSLAKDLSAKVQLDMYCRRVIKGDNEERSTHPNVSAILNFLDCNFSCHQRCAEKVFIKCISSNSAEDPDEAKLNHRIPHRFETFTNLSPTWCSHCGHMLTFGRRHKKCSGKLKAYYSTYELCIAGMKLMSFICHCRMPGHGARWLQ